MKVNGNVIRKKREELGMSLEDFASKVEVLSEIANGWENGDYCYLQNNNVTKIANVLHVSIDELIDNEGYEKSQVNSFNEVLQESISGKWMGKISDGYHTFDELYHHRAMLTIALCNLCPDRFWKSKKHHDGTMYDNMFIVGMNTEFGSATYHYDIDPYWDMFCCGEIPKAPVFDGHTPEDAINRIVRETEEIRNEKHLQSGL